MENPELHHESLVSRIYNINETDFDGVAMDVWKYQFQFNPVYRNYCEVLGIREEDVQSPSQIPFLPAMMFRSHSVQTGTWEPEAIFKSSGTTGAEVSQHFIRDLNWYHHHANQCFRMSFGPPSDYAWLALLPSYLERSDASLVDMVQYFMDQSVQPENAFMLNAEEEFISKMEILRKRNQPTILFGVSFALLDVFERYKIPVWDKLFVIETGGMKGRGPEITRSELYTRLRQHHAGLHIASEYGMTELLSQSYKIDHYFVPGLTQRIAIRDISDPFQLLDFNQRGLINIIDLANLETCSFIATDDIGIVFQDGRFDVLGRLDNSDLRGCNLMYTSA
jgi:hypothetical protein